MSRSNWFMISLLCVFMLFKLAGWGSRSLTQVDVKQFISEKMVQVEPWKSQSSAEFDNALEAMEKLVMNRLYN